MARAVAEGTKSVQGVDVELTYHAQPETLGDYDAILIGVPTYHHDMTIDMKKLFEETATAGISLKNKIGAAFGSYGWSGEAPKLTLEILKNKFEANVTEPPLLAKYTPDQTMLERCREFGKKIAERLIHKV